MAAAFRWMGRQGYGDEGGAGHISVRDPILPDHFWINPFFKSFRHMKVSDLVLVNEDGEVSEGGNMHAINAAGFMIHSAIHKARPDVVAACHAHSIAGKAFSSLGIELDISTQDSCFFWHDHTVYKYLSSLIVRMANPVRSHGVVLSTEEGARIAKKLGKMNNIILQNHGLLTLGRTVDEAVSMFGVMDRCCAAQLLADAAAAGRGIKPTLIDDEDAKFTYDSLRGEDMRYLGFAPAYEEILEESKGEFLL
jgi:ribulose-5-phosphate 4-epimerase/fuculose-1-phosphate aldolase